LTTVLVAKGLAGREIDTQIATLVIALLRADRRNEPACHGSLDGIQ
jgi:hypothetical protein